MTPLVVLAALVLLVSGTARAQVVVTTSGPVQGITAGGVSRFLAIPYAEPPIGALRWQRPVPVTPSPTTLDGTVPGFACTQTVQDFSARDCRENLGQATGTEVGSEDCLTLSVWRPAAEPTTPRPVLVWIHGGAFVTGCAKDGLTEGTDLALHGVDGQVVIAIQYRLGPLGFFSLPELAAGDPDASVGNYGLLDMILALQWVQANAAAFGGDPNNVTIFGESAGGVAACALLASPLTLGLFQRAIVESGNCAQAIPREPGPGASFPAGATAYDRGSALAANPAFGCTDPQTRAACMRAIPNTQLVDVYGQSLGALGLPPTNMVIDDYVIDEQPQALLAGGASADRDLVIGSNANEMTVFTTTLSLPTAQDYENLILAQAGPYVAPILLSIWPASEFASPRDAYRRLSEDIFFVCNTLNAAKAVRDAGGSAYAYHFAYDPGALMLGSFHGLELFYVFGNLVRLQSLLIFPDAGDTLLSTDMQEAWTSYARTGAPNAIPAWPAFDPGDGGAATQGSAYVWNLNNLSNTAAYSVAQGGAMAFRDGRCAELEAAAPILNADQDTLTNDADNCDTVTNSDQADHDLDTVGSACDACPYAANLDQADTSGVGGGGPDGIADACQCGDVDDDVAHDVDAADLAALRLALAGVTALSPGGQAKCSVAGGTTACDLLDSVVIARRLASLQPLLAPACDAATPPA
jgi:para-nitrobenzyl esterase